MITVAVIWKWNVHAEEYCVALEMESEKTSQYELLEAKFNALEVEKLAIEDEIKVLKRRNDELELRITWFEDKSKISCRRERVVEGVVDLTEENGEEDKVLQLLIENKIIQCEKKRAEDEVGIWKEKCKGLESRVVQLEKEILIWRGKEFDLDGKQELNLELPGAGSLKGIETKACKNGPCVPFSSGLMQTKEKVLDLDETSCAPPTKGIGLLQEAGGTPSVDIPCGNSIHVKGEKRGMDLGAEIINGSRDKEKMVHGGEWSFSRDMSPSTPGGARPTSFDVIDISDSDVETDRALGNVSNEKEMTLKNSYKRALADQSDEEAMMGCKWNSPISTTPKRKRASNIVTSDSENDNDKIPPSSDCASGGAVSNRKSLLFETSCNMTRIDQSDGEDKIGNKGNSPISRTPKRKRASMMVASDSESDDDKIPLSKLRRKNLQESWGNNVTEVVTLPRRRLKTLRQCEETGGIERDSPNNLNTNETKYYSGIPTTEDVGDDKLGEAGSESEGESLGGFIVDDDKMEEVGSDDVSDANGASSESEDASDDDMDFSGILSRIRKDKDQKSKWEFMGDMLAAFGKDPELCMRAICALNRRQTNDEQGVKLTIHSNKRGFSQSDAPRGTTLALFLTDGNPDGDLMKSVKELSKYDSGGLEVCRVLAAHYPKQLFEIYENGEDEYFPGPKYS